MSRKDTVWGHKHRDEDAEIKRIIEYYGQFGISITKLEASAILAERSKDVFWTEKKARDVLLKLRGLL